MVATESLPDASDWLIREWWAPNIGLQRTALPCGIAVKPERSAK